jgi:hypothetical protein
MRASVTACTHFAVTRNDVAGGKRKRGHRNE